MSPFYVIIQSLAGQQQYDGNKDAGQNTGRIQPHIGDLTAASGRKDLDSLIGQRSEHAAQHGHADVPDILPGIHPHTQHEQKALQHILAEVCQLAHDVVGQALGKGRMAQTAQSRLQQSEHPAAGHSRHRGDLHGIGKDEPDAGDECNGKDHTSRNDPQRGAFSVIVFHCFSPEP